jgi:hypothetical protein
MPEYLPPYRLPAAGLPWAILRSLCSANRAAVLKAVVQNLPLLLEAVTGMRSSSLETGSTATASQVSRHVSNPYARLPHMCGQGCNGHLSEFTLCTTPSWIPQVLCCFIFTSRIICQQTGCHVSSGSVCTQAYAA